MHCTAILTLMLFMTGSGDVTYVHLPFLISLGSSAQEVSKPRPDASGNYRVGDGVSEPTLVFTPDPEYTDKARRKKVDGTVVVSLTVDSAGKPQDVRISRSLADQVSKKLQSAALSLDESAIKTVKEYRFKPAEFEGKPVSVGIKVEVNYRIY
jgi:TonB family protein